METASPPRKDFSPAQRQKIVNAYRRGKLTQREFARQAGIGFSTLRKWLHQATVPSPSREACFVEVPNLISSSPPPAPYRLHLPNQVLLEIGPGFQTGEVAALLGMLITP